MSVLDGQKILWNAVEKLPNVVKFVFLYNYWYLIYLNNRNQKVQVTDFEFISNVFIV